MGKIIRVGIFYLENNGIEETAHELEAFLKNKGVKVLTVSELRSTKSARGLVIMSLGGDGTFLRASHLGMLLNAPVIGVNLGNLGFLTDVEARDLFDAANEMLNGNFMVERRMTLKLVLTRSSGKSEEFVAINDFVLHRELSSKILDLEVFVNGMNAGFFRSDGLVVSTATGSTAYALSLGGPIITPTSNVYSLTFIAPHRLTARPVVFSELDKLSIQIKSNGKARLKRDGEEIAVVSKFDRLEIFKNKNLLNILHLRKKNFFEVLNKKFGWGG